MFPFQITAQTLKVELPLGTHRVDINYEQAKDCGRLISRSLNFTLATIILSEVMIHKSTFYLVTHQWIHGKRHIYKGCANYKAKAVARG